MKRLIFAACAALALSGCGALGALTGVPSAPVQVADRTTLDEQGALGAELAYKAARMAVEMAVDAGVIRGERATRFAALDNKAYRALGAVRGAYRAGNATDYGAALAEARGAVEDLLALSSGE